MKVQYAVRILVHAGALLACADYWQAHRVMFQLFRVAQH